MNSDLTVLLPTLNGEPYLQDALDSLSAQTFGDWFCLALDDGSTDGTRDILHAHAGRDARFHIITNETPSGVAPALAQLLSRVETPWVARLDGDDRYHPDKLLHQHSAAQSRLEIDLWAGSLESIGETTPGWLEYLDWLNSVVTEEEILREAFTECPVTHGTWYVRTEVLRRVGGYHNGPFPEDYDLFLRMLVDGVRFGKVPASRYLWRDHGTRQTRTCQRYAHDAFLRLKTENLPKALLTGRFPQWRGRPIAIRGAGKTGKLVATELKRNGLPADCFLDPVKEGREVAGLDVRHPDASPPGEHLILVAVRPKGLRGELREEFDAGGYVFGRDYLWFY